MMYGAIDLHARFSQIRVLDADGRVVRHKRVTTSAETLRRAFSGVGAIRIVVEAGASDVAGTAADAPGTADAAVIGADAHRDDFVTAIGAAASRLSAAARQ